MAQRTIRKIKQKILLSDTPINLIKKYTSVLIKNGVKVNKMIIFGSYAKGKAKSWSDLDVCVVSNQFGKDDYDETVMLEKLTIKVDPMIEPHPYSPKDLANPFDPLAYEINKTGKVIQ